MAKAKPKKSLKEMMHEAISIPITSHPDGLDGKKVAAALRELAELYEDDDDELAAGSGVPGPRP